MVGRAVGWDLLCYVFETSMVIIGIRRYVIRTAWNSVPIL